MRLYLAVAVLLLAFVAYTEAQDTTEKDFSTRFTDFTQLLRDRSRAAYEAVKNSDTVQKVRDWATDGIETIKNAVSGN